MPYYFVLLGLVVLIATLLLWYQKEAKRTRNSALHLLDDLDNDYEDFVQKRLNLAFIQDDNWQDRRDELIEELQEVMKPTLDALAALVSSTRHMSINLPLDSPVFKNISALAEAGFARRPMPAELEQQKESFYAAFRDAAKADMRHRWLDEQTGERLAP